MLGVGFDIAGLALRQGRETSAPPAPSAWSPESLAPEAWYDSSDLSTLYHDAAMTQPVSGDGDPVGAWRDKSGNGHHLLQSTASARPLYRTDGVRHWIEYDGGSASLGAAQLPFATQVTLGLAFEALSFPASYPMILSNGTFATDGSGRQPLIYLDANARQVVKGWWADRLMSVSLAQEVTASGPLTVMSSVDGSLASLSVDETMVPATNLTMTHDPGGSFALGLAGFHGRIFGCVICNASVSETEQAQLSAHLDALGQG